MKTFISLLLLLSLTFVLVGFGTPSRSIGQETRKSTATTQVLFNGESLDGWSGDERFWRVEDGVIVGQTTEENPTEKNTFLIWKGGEIADFELRLKYKMEGGNSGVQIRSQVVEGFRVHGYQADFDANNVHTGIWYDEGGRGTLVRRCQKVTLNEKGEATMVVGEVDEDTYLEGLSKDNWNEVVIIGKGNRLTHSINGNVSAVLVDGQKEHAESSGILALQLHAGPPMTIRFKDIELIDLKR